MEPRCYRTFNEPVSAMAQTAQPMHASTPAMGGDARALIAQLGDGADFIPADAMAGLASGTGTGLPSLRKFLAEYQSRVLAVVELPAILRAHRHADRNELRELLSLDRELSDAALPAEFKLASQSVGRRRLQKLHPLRDHRLVQRYIAAVDAGQAHAWHTLVFGVSLSVYSLPLRQGLLHYTQKTLAGFVASVAPGAGLVNGEVTCLVEELCKELPKIVEAVIGGTDLASFHQGSD